MGSEETDSADAIHEFGHRTIGASRPRRPWLLIAAALLLAVLSTLLWVRWRDARTRVDQLQVELRQVYAEAETLRTQAARAQQRIAQLERELRAAPTSRPAPSPPKEPRR
jgi:cell division protein FtsB